MRLGNGLRRLRSVVSLHALLAEWSEAQGLTASVGGWDKAICEGRREVRMGKFCVTHWRWDAVISCRAGDETVRLDLQERSNKR